MMLRMVLECHAIRSIFQAINKRDSIMKEAFDFLSKHKDVAFATVEQNKPKIRVFQIMNRKGIPCILLLLRTKKYITS